MFFSIVTPIYNPKPDFLQKAISSIENQDFQNWEWILVNDNSEKSEGIDLLENIARNSRKIKLLSNKENRNISYSTNKAISHAIGKWIIFFDQDDLLHKNALVTVFSYLRKYQEAKILYTDEDKVDENDQHFDPYFKPDWNPALLSSQNYFCHLLAVEKKYLENSGKLRVGYEGAQDWDLCLRLTSNLKSYEVVHVPEILYHWRSHDGSTAKSLSAKFSIVSNSSKKTLCDHIFVHGLNANAEKVDDVHWNIKRSLSLNHPSLFLVIVFESQKERNDFDATELLENTEYGGEIQIFNLYQDDESKLRFWENETFNRPIVSEEENDIVCILSSRVKPIKVTWLRDMVAYAVDSKIGFCGPKFVNVKRDIIVSCGLIADNDGSIKSIYESLPRSFCGDKYRAKLQQNFTFIHPGCIVGRVGLFRQHCSTLSLSSIMNACLSLHLKGLYNLVLPSIEMDINEILHIDYDFSRNKKISNWFRRVGYDPSFSPNLIIKDGLPIPRYD